MKIVLPLPPNMANGRMHWRVKNRKRENYMQVCTAYRSNGWTEGKRPRKPLTRATIAVTLFLHQPMDADNRMARCKWPVDWLKADGWIVDDSDKHLTWLAIPEQRVDRKNPRVEITLEAAW